MTWQYSQSKRTLSKDGIDHTDQRAYSGKDQYKNDPLSQHVKNFGPIPRGKWKIGKSYSSDKTGPLTITLIPLPETPTYGRTDFRIHGDSMNHLGKASEGCIILNRATRQIIIASDDNELEVIQ
jgi:hypothetical protein